MEDPYLAKILDKHLKKEEPLYEEIKGLYFFAKALDKFGNYHYLSADSEEAIEDYCEGGVLGDSMAICNWATYVDPIMLAFHFKWVGKRRNPFVISKMRHSDYKGQSGKSDGYETAIKRDLDKW